MAALGSTPELAAQTVKELALIQLWREEAVSGGVAAEALGLDHWAFVQLLGRHNVPYLDQSTEESREDLDTLGKHRRQKRPILS